MIREYPNTSYSRIEQEKLIVIGSDAIIMLYAISFSFIVGVVVGIAVGSLIKK